ncbi:hypothetical protein MEM_02350, partial [Candida albicans L26]
MKVSQILPLAGAISVASGFWIPDFSNKQNSNSYPGQYKGKGGYQDDCGDDYKKGYKSKTYSKVKPITSTDCTTPIQPTGTTTGYTKDVVESTSYTTDTAYTTTVITVTKCDGGSCSHTAVTTGVTIITVTTNDVITEYTTYCPLTSTPATE